MPGRDLNTMDRYSAVTGTLLENVEETSALSFIFVSYAKQGSFVDDL